MIKRMKSCWSGGKKVGYIFFCVEVVAGQVLQVLGRVVEGVGVVAGSGLDPLDGVRQPQVGLVFAHLSQHLFASLQPLRELVGSGTAVKNEGSLLPFDKKIAQDIS